MKRSTAGGISGLLAAIGGWLVVPPTVIQELLWKVLSIQVSVDLAALVGTILVGICGWAATEFQRDKSSTEQAQAMVDNAVTDRAQDVAAQQVPVQK